ncbi:MAG TPA: exosortase F system-associated protein [Flavobacterium sp.]|jgi:exosortase F-associated protein|nr:exosortase F system-associated protein [Flavobacterium sp.]
MLRELLSNKLKLILILLLVGVLAVIRGFEDQLFYDPFALYFRGDYLSMPFPHYDTLHLMLSMGLRYWLNAAISLIIIFAIFSDAALTKFATILYLFFFVILIVALFLILLFSDAGNNFLLFNIRRFLIQPLLLLLFVPAFYYQKQKDKK